MGMHYLKEAEALYFKASKAIAGSDVLPTRTKSYKSRKVKAHRDVFRAYIVGDPPNVANYRHVGFERRFKRIGGKWFLEISPMYHFTTDGHEPHPFREEYLAKIKSIEGNNAVGGLVVMFASLLQDEPSLLWETYAHLGFGSLERVQLPVGIEDKSWLKRDEVQPPPRDESEPDPTKEAWLFDDES